MELELKAVDFWAVIAAGGSGERLGGTLPKQFLPVDGRPILAHSLRAFGACRGLRGATIVVKEGFEDRARVIAAEFPFPCTIVTGGATRQKSVLIGLRHANNAFVKPGYRRVVLIHDAARPFVSPKRIADVVQAVSELGGAILAYPIYDAVKVNDNGRLVSVPGEKPLIAARTPQGFFLDDILKAHLAAHMDGFSASDDAAVAERYDMPVFYVKDDPENIKVTTKADIRPSELSDYINGR